MLAIGPSALIRPEFRAKLCKVRHFGEILREVRNARLPREQGKTQGTTPRKELYTLGKSLQNKGGKYLRRKNATSGAKNGTVARDRKYDDAEEGDKEDSRGEEDIRDETLEILMSLRKLIVLLGQDMAMTIASCAYCGMWNPLTRITSKLSQKTYSRTILRFRCLQRFNGAKESCDWKGNARLFKFQVASCLFLFKVYLHHTILARRSDVSVCQIPFSHQNWQCCRYPNI